MTITTTLPGLTFRGACLSRPHQLQNTYHQLWYSITPGGSGHNAFDGPNFRQKLIDAQKLPGFDINHRYPYPTHDKQTLLHHAVIQNNPTAIRVLLNAGANPNTYDHLHQVPLHFAKNQQCMAELLSASANPNALDSQGRSPLHRAAQSHHHSTLARIHTLLRHGAHPDIKTRYGSTPADLAKAHHQALPILHALNPEQYPEPSASGSEFAAQRSQAIRNKPYKKHTPPQNLPEWDFGPYEKSAHKHKTQAEQPTLKKQTRPKDR